MVDDPHLEKEFLSRKKSPGSLFESVFVFVYFLATMPWCVWGQLKCLSVGKYSWWYQVGITNVICSLKGRSLSALFQDKTQYCQSPGCVCFGSHTPPAMYGHQSKTLHREEYILTEYVSACIKWNRFLSCILLLLVDAISRRWDIKSSFRVCLWSPVYGPVLLQTHQMLPYARNHIWRTYMNKL